ATIPYKPLDSFAINTAIWMLVAKSEVDITDKRHGSRAFRSSIASNMVNDGVSTEVVRKVLGHGTKHAIRHYARLDI
ncbi:tyrosine-type recombinase/integrase, partial [Thomasclavelia ramosa]